jgi:hypothetical protein
MKYMPTDLHVNYLKTLVQRIQANETKHGCKAHFNWHVDKGTRFCNCPVRGSTNPPSSRLNPNKRNQVTGSEFLAETRLLGLSK